MTSFHRPPSRRAVLLRAARAAAAAVAVLVTSVLAAALPVAAHASPAIASVVAAPVVAAPVVAAPGGVATAAGDVTWSLVPKDGKQGEGRANYAYAVEPGDRITDTLVVTNRSAAPLELAVYATDAVTTPSGHLDLLPAAEEPADLGTWVDVRAPGGAVTIPAGGSVDVPFTLQVPDDAAPGDHSGGLVTSMRQQTGDGALSVDRRLALRVHVRVAGGLAPGLTVSDVQVDVPAVVNPVGAATATVSYTLTNTGNARVVPTESVVVTGPGGSGEQRVSGTLDEVLPGSVVRRSVAVPDVRPLVRAGADVRVDGLVVGVGGGGATTAVGEAAGWAVPWSLVVVLLLVVAAAAGWPLLRARRQRRRATP